MPTPVLCLDIIGEEIAGVLSGALSGTASTESVDLTLDCREKEEAVLELVPDVALDMRRAGNLGCAPFCSTGESTTEDAKLEVDAVLGISSSITGRWPAAD